MLTTQLEKYIYIFLILRKDLFPFQNFQLIQQNAVYFQVLHSVVRLSLEVLSLFKSTISLRLSTDSPSPPSPSTVGEMLAGH